eukprot:12931994-Prorocentrum_lima.AAC.1
MAMVLSTIGNNNSVRRFFSTGWGEEGTQERRFPWTKSQGDQELEFNSCHHVKQNLLAWLL